MSSIQKSLLSSSLRIQSSTTRRLTLSLAGKARHNTSSQSPSQSQIHRVHTRRPQINSPFLRRDQTASYTTSTSSTAAPASSTSATPSDTSTSSLQVPEHLDDAERHIFEKLSKQLEPVRLEVQDISGGCGSMYGIEIVAERFRGLGMLKSQRLVNDILAEEIKGWHGVQLKTLVP